MIKYQAKIVKDGDTYTVSFPDLAGCLSSASSRSKAIENAREALSLYLEEARDERWEIPVAKTRSGRQYIWITPFPDVAMPLMIRSARLKSGLSQRVLAKRLAISVQQLQKLETPGKSNPTVKTLAAISEALNGSLDIRIVA